MDGHRLIRKDQLGNQGGELTEQLSCETVEIEMLTEMTKSNSYNTELQKHLSFLVI